MIYTPAAHLVGHFRAQGLRAAFCTQFPHNANNVYSYFSVEVLRDMVRFLAAALADGEAKWGGSGDMGWLHSYAAATWPPASRECTWWAPKEDTVAKYADSDMHKVYHVGKCDQMYSQRFHAPRRSEALPRFRVGNNCRNWDNGVGVDSFAAVSASTYMRSITARGGMSVTSASYGSVGCRMPCARTRISLSACGACTFRESRSAKWPTTCGGMTAPTASYRTSHRGVIAPMRSAPTATLGRDAALTPT